MGILDKVVITNNSQYIFSCGKIFADFGLNMRYCLQGI